MNQPQLRVRWLGKTSYTDALLCQEAAFAGSDDYLLLTEHTPAYTFGVNADPVNVTGDLGARGATQHHIKRGGDVTFHGPGQLTGYPILTVADHHLGQLANTSAYVKRVEQLIIDTCVALGLTNVGRIRRFPGVWVDPDGDAPRKIAAVGIRLDRGRSMHGFAFNVDTDLSWYDPIVPCGIAEYGVTSLANEGIDVSMTHVVDVLCSQLEAFGFSDIDRADANAVQHPTDLSRFAPPSELVPKPTRGRAEDPSSIAIGRKPEWMRVQANMGEQFKHLKSVVHSKSLVTVCEEAGCPNIFECWQDGTATFMMLGERCTRACTFCLVDTRKPLAPDVDEPDKIAQAVEEMSLDFAVLTMVARDDLDDGGAAHVAKTIETIRDRVSHARVEVLVSDFKGNLDAIDTVIAARPDVFNHNIETVLRLQREVRTSANYARTLGVLGRAKAAGLTVKSGLIVGMGETDYEVMQTLADLANVGVDIVTIGQYLRPTQQHRPIDRWVHPDTFADYKAFGESRDRGHAGIGHVESSPLTRSSYHAKSAANTAQPVAATSVPLTPSAAH